MTTLKLYYKEILTFLNSLTIKFHDQFIYMENNLNQYYGLEMPSPDQSKYYLNLNGELHHTDEKIYSIVIDTESLEEINKDTINQFPIYKNELLKFGKYFNELVSLYPRQALYIRGILNPFSYEDVKDLEDGTILYYQKDLIDINELSFISDLENFIKHYIQNINIKEYNIDPLFQPSIYGALFNILPLYTLALRMRRILSHEASGFDIYNYLASYKYMEKSDLSFIDRPTLIYLYGELGRLKTNIGSNAVLEDVINEIFGKNGVGVGRTNIYKTVPELIVDNSENIQLPYNKNNYIFRNKKANRAFRFDNNIYVVEDIVDMENIMGLVSSDDIHRTVNNSKSFLGRLNKDNALTKTFMFDSEEVRIFYNTTMLNLTFNNIIGRLEDERFVIDRYFINPTDGIRYKLNKRSLHYLIIKCMSSMTGNDADNLFIEGYQYTHLFNKDLDIDALVNRTFHQEKIRNYAEAIMDIMTPYLTVKNRHTFKNHILALREILIEMQYIISNCNDLVLAADLKVLYEGMFLYGKIDEDDTISLNDHLQKYGRDIPVNGKLAFDTLIKICKEIFDIDIDEVSIIRERYRKYVSFIKKFKSYTVQFIHDDDFENMVTPFDTSLDIGQKHVLVGNITEGCFKRYVRDETSLYLKTTPFKDNVLQGSSIFEATIIPSGKSSLLILRDRIQDLSNQLPIMVSEHRVPELYHGENLTINLENEGEIKEISDESVKVRSIDNSVRVIMDKGITVLPSDYFIIEKK